MLTLAVPGDRVLVAPGTPRTVLSCLTDDPLAAGGGSEAHIGGDGTVPIRATGAGLIIKGQGRSRFRHR